jgi:hypothetical protein
MCYCRVDVVDFRASSFVICMMAVQSVKCPAKANGPNLNIRGVNDSQTIARYARLSSKYIRAMAISKQPALLMGRAMRAVNRVLSFRVSFWMWLKLTKESPRVRRNPSFKSQRGESLRKDSTIVECSMDVFQLCSHRSWAGQFGSPPRSLRLKLALARALCGSLT